MSNLELLYQEAKEQPRLRRSFLSQIDLQEMGPYVRRVTYCLPQTYGTDECTPMAVNPHTLSEENLLGYQARIIVHPLAFYEDYIKSLDDFLSILIDHEGFHARECFLKPSIISLKAFCIENHRDITKIDRESWISTYEDRAYQNQLLQHAGGRRKLSSGMIDFIHDRMS